MTLHKNIHFLITIHIFIVVYYCSAKIYIINNIFPLPDHPFDSRITESILRHLRTFSMSAGLPGQGTTISIAPAALSRLQNWLTRPGKAKKSICKYFLVVTIILKAEDLNTLIGNAFRTAYAVQLAEERGTLDLRSRPLENGVNSVSNSPVTTRRDFTASRSIESLLSAANQPENCYEVSNFEEPLYETTDFTREQRVRMSDSTLSNRFQTTNNGTFGRRERSRVSYYNMMRGCVIDRVPYFPFQYRSFQEHGTMRTLQHPHLMPSGQYPSPNDHTVSRSMAHPLTSNMGAITRSEEDILGPSSFGGLSHQQSARSSRRSLWPGKPSKPNTLPVLNCLFAALNNNGVDEEGDAATPYTDVTPSFIFNNNNNLNGKQKRLHPSFTHDDLRLNTSSGGTPTPPSQKSSTYTMHESSTTNSESSGDSLPNGTNGFGRLPLPQPPPYHLHQHQQQHNFGKSKSAHTISCEVYSEVADSMTLANQRRNQR